MSVFDKDLATKENISLLEFYNLWKIIVEREFNSLYKRFDGDLGRVSSVYNSAIDKNRQKFEEHGIYHPWLLCTPIADINPPGSKFLVTILYSEDPTLYVHKDRKVFLRVTIPISYHKANYPAIKY